MMKTILCWLFGHKTVFKSFTGEYGIGWHPFEGQVQVPVLRWERSRFCLRCGRGIHSEDDKSSD